MSDYRISFIYQDSHDDWWFAVAREGSEASGIAPWFDNLIYAGPCLTREDAENCADLFQNTGYGAEELGPGGLLAPPPGRLQFSPLALKPEPAYLPGFESLFGKSGGENK
jgi:hypothetical protein